MKTILNKLTLLSFVAIFAFAFTACNDVAGPNDSVSDLLSDSINHDANYGEPINGDGPIDDDDDNGVGGDGDLIGEGDVCAEGSAVLKAGRTGHFAGTVSYYIEEGTLFVTYTAADGVTINETHLWVGTDISDMPAAGNGAPRNGHFPYGGSYNGITEVTYEIELIDIAGFEEGSDIYIVAHAVVQGSRDADFRGGETAYAGDEKGDGPRWWWYIKANTEECEDEQLGSGVIGAVG